MTYECNYTYDKQKVKQQFIKCLTKKKNHWEDEKLNWQTFNEQQKVTISMNFL